MRSFYRITLLLALLVAIVCSTKAQLVISPKALTITGDYGMAINGQSFQKEALLSYKGYQYIAFYDANRYVCVARRCLQNNQLAVVRFPHQLSKDDAHNVISMGICPNDGTLHLAFDHHNADLHYIRSKKLLVNYPTKVRWELANFLPETNRLDTEIEDLSYPQFVTTPTGNLQLFYRTGESGKGETWIATYQAHKHTWSNRHQIDSSEGDFEDDLGSSSSRNAYYNGFTYNAKGILQTTFTWREDAQGANHDIGYAYSPNQGMTWYNNRGGLIAGGEKYLSISSEKSIIRPVDRKQSLMNQQAQATDNQGNTHTVMWRKLPQKPFEEGKFWDRKASGYYHLYRLPSGKWRENLVASPAGTRPQLIFDSQNNAYLIYTRQAPNDQSQHPIYFTQGILVVMKATAARGWLDWQVWAEEPTHYSILEPQVDTYRLKHDHVLSVLMQDIPTKAGAASRLWIWEKSVK